VDTRPARLDDLDAITDLMLHYETHWFGTPETSAAEAREGLELIPDLAENSWLVFVGGALHGVGARLRSDTIFLVDPDAAADVHAELLRWFAGGEPHEVHILSKDEPSRDRATAAGWTHRKSSFDLLRAVDPTLEIPEPSWPDGVSVTGYDDPHTAAVYHLIYVEAGWTEVAGHPHRDYDEWRQVFITEHTVPDQQVLAWRGDRLVGVAMGRTWDDGTGWISQLATAKDERGKGLGRAMLFEALRRRREAGATALGLSVQAENRGALKMYLSAGLEIDHEWMEYVPPS
jgi:mycothiol synthase